MRKSTLGKPSPFKSLRFKTLERRIVGVKLGSPWNRLVEEREVERESDRVRERSGHEWVSRRPRGPD